MHALRSLPTLALGLALVAGHVTDQTTGQPLPHVKVTAVGAKTLHAVTDADGAYTLRGVPAGHYRVTLQSDDVPPRTYDLVVGKAANQTHDFVACSTTLDYNCSGW
ncbi:MAG TPA: carboxypeptidase regulatory-like domain-containing protein [Candidatus Sulfotelmatobacter sp.]|nr:carboxypeptidase regulatory-like domain-containing protein [Candidatus Sulfotelmatobacter sp.]